MTLDVQQGEARIDARSAHLRFALDGTTLSVESADGSLVLRGFVPLAVVGRHAQRPVELRSRRVRECATPHGDATRIELCFGTRGPLELLLAIELSESWPGLVLELGARNGGTHPVRIRALEPVSWRRSEGGELILPGAADELRFFRMGYQSWSPASFPRLADREPRPRLPLIHTVHYGPFTPPARRHEYVSDFATSLRAGSAPGLTLGFLTHRRFLNHVRLRERGARPESLAARVSTEERELAPGDSLSGERLWIGLDPAGGDGIAEWAERCGREMGAPVPAQSGSGWCSWYQYFTRVSARDVRANVETLAKLEAPVDTIQIDDGFQAAVGDWLEWSPGFPDGLEPLAREIRSHGFRAGLWLAPLLVSRASRLASEHPDWILRGARGRPRVANLNGAWKGVVCYALDATHPEVLDWLRELGRAVRALGFDYLKLDFLYAGALMGRRHDPRVASAEAYRGAIAAFREGAGPDAMLLGCGAPLGPSVGLFEAMRIGPDVAPVWRARGLDRVFGIRAAPSAENSLRNILARAALHQRLWLNDPDCVLLRDADTRLGLDEVRALVGAVAVSGGLVMLSDDLDRMGPERRELMRRLLPPLGRAPEVGPVVHGIPEGLLQRLPDGGGLVYRVNLDTRTRSIEIDLPALGFPGPVHVYDVWTERALGACSGVLRFASVRSRGSLLLRLSPADGRPRLLGSSLHLGAGSIETASVASSAEGGARLLLRLPGPRSGRLLLGLPDREPVPLWVGFRDELEVELRSAGVGVEESEEMDD